MFILGPVALAVDGKGVVKAIPAQQWLIEAKMQRVTRASVRKLAAEFNKQLATNGVSNLRSPMDVPYGVEDHSSLLSKPDKAKFRAISQYVVHDGKDGDYTILRLDCLADCSGKVA